MLFGEQPGGREDIEGHPFVGPAGHVLDDGDDRAAAIDDFVADLSAVGARMASHRD